MSNSDKKDKNDVPIYIKKIDFIYNQLLKQSVLENLPIKKFLPYVVYAMPVLSIATLYEVRLLSSKISNFEIKLNNTLTVFNMYKANIELLNGTVCFKCHSNPNSLMSKMVYKYDNFDSFREYVRKGGKMKNGVVVHPISEKEISDELLKQIYEQASRW